MNTITIIVLIHLMSVKHTEDSSEVTALSQTVSETDHTFAGGSMKTNILVFLIILFREQTSSYEAQGSILRYL